MDDKLWNEEMSKAQKQGALANSIFDNPYWKTYPKDENSFEESKARHWVSGYVEKLQSCAN